MTTQRARPIPLKLGDRVEFIGAPRSNDAGKQLARGDVGLVVFVKAPYRGSGVFVRTDDDGEDLYDESEDGYATVQWPRWQNTLARVDSEGKTWRKVGTS